MAASSAMMRSSRSVRLASGVVAEGRAKSTGTPSAMASTISRRRGSSSSSIDTAHFRREPRQGPGDAHTRGGGARLRELAGDFLVGEPELDAEHNQLAFLLAQRIQRALVA